MPLFWIKRKKICLATKFVLPLLRKRTIWNRSVFPRPSFAPSSADDIELSQVQRHGKRQGDSEKRAAQFGWTRFFPVRRILTTWLRKIEEERRALPCHHSHRVILLKFLLWDLANICKLMTKSVRRVYFNIFLIWVRWSFFSEVVEMHFLILLRPETPP